MPGQSVTRRKVTHVGLLILHIRMYGNRSLKEKRSIIKSLKAQLHSRYNISISEVEKQDRYNESVVAVSMVNPSQKYINQIFDKIVEFVRIFRSVELVDYTMEFY